MKASLAMVASVAADWHPHCLPIHWYGMLISKLSLFSILKLAFVSVFRATKKKFKKKVQDSAAA